MTNNSVAQHEDLFKLAREAVKSSGCWHRGRSVPVWNNGSTSGRLDYSAAVGDLYLVVTAHGRAHGILAAKLGYLANGHEAYPNGYAWVMDRAELKTWHAGAQFEAEAKRRERENALPLMPKRKSRMWA